MINCNKYVLEDVTGLDTDRTMSNEFDDYTGLQIQYSDRSEMS